MLQEINKMWTADLKYSCTRQYMTELDGGKSRKLKL